MDKTLILAKLEEIYKECRQEGWYEENNFMSPSMPLVSVNQAKEFINYLDINSNCIPSVVPYVDGYIGLEWNFEDVLISVIFRKPSLIDYAIISKFGNDYGTETQDEINQKELVKKIKNLIERKI